MEIDITRSARTTIKEYKPEDCVPPLGTYRLFYKPYRHDNYMGDIEILGPIVISTHSEETITRIYIRSIIGLKEYFFYTSHLNINTYEHLKYGLQRYILDFKNSNMEMAIPCVQQKDNFSLLSSKLKNLFVGNSVSNKNKDDTVSVSSNGSSINTARDSINNVKMEMMKKINQVKAEKILNELIVVEPAYYGMIENLDDTSNKDELTVNVIIDKNKDNSILYSLLGNKMKKEEFVLLKRRKRLEGELEVSVIGLNGKGKESRSGKYHSLMELVDTQRNYISHLHDFMNEFIEPLKGCFNTIEEYQTYINDIFGPLIKVYNFEKELSKLLEEAIEGCDPEGNNVDEKIDLVFEMFFSKMEDFYEYYDYFTKYNDTLEKIKNKKTDKSFKKILCNKNAKMDIEGYMILPVQRLVRYKLLLRNIYKFMNKESKCIGKIESVLHSFDLLLQRLNEERGVYDGVRLSFKIQRIVKDCPPDILKNNRIFISQLDCLDSSDSYLTLFLFTDMLIIAGRRNNTIIDVTTDEAKDVFFFVKSVFLENVIIKKRKYPRFVLEFSEKVSEHEYKKMNNSIVVRDDYNILESVSFFCDDKKLYNKFLNDLTFYQNNLKLLKYKNELFVKTEDSFNIYFHVFDINEYSKYKLECDISIDCTQNFDTFVRLPKFSLSGTISDDGRIRIEDIHNRKYFSNEKGIDDLKKHIVCYLRNTFDVFTALPPFTNYKVLNIRNEAIIQYKYLKALGCLKLNDFITFTSSPIPLAEKIDRFVTLLNYTEKRIKKLFESGKLLSTVSAEDADCDNNAHSITLEEAMKLGPLYCNGNASVCNKILEKIMKRGEIKLSSLDKYNIVDITSSIIYYLKKNIYDFITFEQINHSHSFIESVNSNEWFNSLCNDNVMFCPVIRHFVSLSEIVSVRLYLHLFEFLYLGCNCNLYKLKIVLYKAMNQSISTK
ncbi:T-lymphoma invasion and metastasis-inducing protein 2 [Astathelohania contejeani]|uniref:T-lymphoma invasion and metastasis-inducing protein 2 n=1 Tax=Astathelohania contejeani TaxID=164912 RepID=A0ABQ7I2R6_9MICR|nr:T-lymphoma invasion and metastasis-inducing protein 2 [Thelohania contejeani]